MKKIYFVIAGIVIIAILVYLKCNANQEQQRVEQLNQQITNGATSVSDHFSKELNDGYGESGLNGLKEIDISGDSR